MKTGTARASFVEFLKTGRIAGIGVGSSMSEVESALGLPPYWTDQNPGRKDQANDNIYYDGLLIGFDSQGNVICLSVPVERPETEPTITWEDEFPSTGVTVEAFRRWLDQHDVRLLSLPKNADSQACFLTSGGVVIFARRAVLTPGPDDDVYPRSKEPYISSFVAGGVSLFVDV